MFGYIICNKNGLSTEEIDRYQSVYCGLCRSLGQRFGQMQRINLNFDMTFLVLFLSSLYEPEETKTEFRCGVHPGKKRVSIQNKYTDYAADMTILLSYYKCCDDWEDENNRLKYYYAKKLKKGYLEIEKRWPRQCESVRRSIEELGKIEKSCSSVPDDATNCSGKLLSELFVYEEDFWSGKLRSFGYELGKFIYLMDAAIDYKKDMKKKNYNPLFSMQKTPLEMQDTLVMTIGNATRQFEKLPLVQDEHLLRNILYGGVWQQYHAKITEKEKAENE